MRTCGSRGTGKSRMIWVGRCRTPLITALVLVGSLGAASPPQVRIVEDISYRASPPDEKLDLFLPDASPGPLPRPAVVFMHGGGWIKGDKSEPRVRNIVRDLAAAGYVVADIDYRLGPNAWPGNLDDCREAVRFIRKNAAKYGVDPRRIAAMGDSAGAHLALMLGLTQSRDPNGGNPASGVSAQVCAVVELYGITDLTTRLHAGPDGTPEGRWFDSHAKEMLGAPRGKDPKLWRDASPVFQVGRSSPPVLIVHGLADSTVDYPQAVELAERLREKGVVHELVLLEGIGHRFDLDSWEGKPLPVDLRAIVLKFLAKSMSGP